MSEHKQEKLLSPGNSGDERTPDKLIGEVKYARGQDKSTKDKSKKDKRGAGDAQVSDLEPEKQGGIGGP